MFNARALIFIPKRSMGTFDAFLPIAVHARQSAPRGLVIDTVLMRRDIEVMLESSRFHAEAYAELTRCRTLPEWGGRFGQLVKFCALLLLLLWRRLTCRSVMILSGLTDKSGSERVLLKIFAIFGRHYWFPASQIGYTPEFAKRFEKSAWAAMAKAGAKDGAAPPLLEVSDIICYRPGERALIEKLTQRSPNFLAIGTPRLYESWRPYVVKHGERHVAQELAENGIKTDEPIVTVILPVPYYFWFREEDACFTLLRQSIAAVRQVFPDSPILVKPKPQHRQIFAQALEPLEDRVAFTLLGLSVLAARSRLAIAIQETSGLFDFLALGVPVIEYGQYSKDWLLVCDGGSAYRDFPGVSHVESAAALKSALGAVARNEVEGPSLADLRVHLGEAHDIAPILQ